MPVALLAFFGIIILLVFVHELGHFVTAKLAGVKVEEFGFGYPPRLVGIKRGETVYSINLLPLGGFVKMLGEEDPSQPRSLASKRPGIRLVVLSAGAIMNALLPILLFTISFMIPKDMTVGDVRIMEVAEHSPADLAGIERGDIIRRVDNHDIENTGDLSYFIQLNLGSETELWLEREGSTPRLATLSPRWDPPEGQGAIGVVVTMENTTTVSQSYPPWEAVPRGISTTRDTFILFKNEVQRWFIAREAPEVAGPVGIAQLTGEVADVGIAPLLSLTAFISINLAIINLLPLPGLDGGRIIFVLLEWVRRGKRVSPQREALVHAIGFALLLSFIFVVSYYDILRMVRGESLIP